MNKTIYLFNFTLLGETFSGKVKIIPEYENPNNNFTFYDKGKVVSISIVDNTSYLDGIYIDDEDYSYGFLLERRKNYTQNIENIRNFKDLITSEIRKRMYSYYVNRAQNEADKIEYDSLKINFISCVNENNFEEISL